MLIDIEKFEVAEQTLFSDVTTQRRAFHAGFMIEDQIYSVGGVNRHEEVLNEFVNIDINNKTCEQ